MPHRLSEPPYWLVWNEDGAAPRVKHGSSGDAEAEAARLARNNPGVSFAVLAVVARVTVRDVQLERFDVGAEVPF